MKSSNSMITSDHDHAVKPTINLYERIDISDTYDFGFERWLHFAVFDFRPVDSPEENMSSNILFTPRATTQSFHWIFSQKLYFKQTSTKRITRSIH